MNFLRNKKIISGLLTIVFVALGVGNPEMVSTATTTAYCSVVACSA